jgi:hypothetical protein
MNRLLLRGLLALYPRAFRDRYGTELASLTDELIRAGELTPLLAVLNLLGGAALEWRRVLTDSRRAGLAVAAAAIMAAAGSFIVAVAGIFYVTSDAQPQSTPASGHSVSAPAASLPGAGCVFGVAPAGLVAFLPWTEAETRAAAEPGQFSWVLVPATVRVPGTLSTETRPLPVIVLPFVKSALASPRPSPAGLCVIWLKPPPARWIVRPALEWMVPKPPS